MPRSGLVKSVRRSFYRSPAPSAGFLLDAIPSVDAVFAGGFQRHRAAFSGDCITVADANDVTATVFQGIPLGSDDRIDRTALSSFALANGGNVFLDSVTNQVSGGTAIWSFGTLRPQVVASNVIVENSLGEVAADFNDDSSMETQTLNLSTSGGFSVFVASELISSINSLDTLVAIFNGAGSLDPTARGLSSTTTYEVNNLDTGTALDIPSPGTGIAHVFSMLLRNGSDARSLIRDSSSLTDRTSSSTLSLTVIESIKANIPSRFWNGLQYNWAFYSTPLTNQEMDDASAFLL